MKHVTLLFLLKEDTGEICLAMKKRGFGEGKLNGTGGKVEAGETVPQAAIREAREEIGVEINENDLEQVATIAFSFDQKPEWNILCGVFMTSVWQHEPTESEEMAPQWFSYDAVPYDRMWVDDQHWLPQVLAGETLQASFHFSNDGSAVLDKKVHTVGRQKKRTGYGSEN